MNGFHANKKYESYKIPGQQQFKLDGAALELPQTKSTQPLSPKPISLDEGLFYEIEYDSSPFPGVGKYVLKPQTIKEPERDEKRELFGKMREIARTYRTGYDNSRFFDLRVQHNNAIIFYKQAVFMKDFTDDYDGHMQFSQYFPNYNIMEYEQLRTYFTWRTEVRKGNVADVSVSYAFLYIYELLANIGVKDPEDGLDQLLFFWKSFRVYNKFIDKYVIKWLKDYHIYYQLPHSFKEFIDKNNLAGHYPNMVDTEDNFDLFCSISKYDIRKSAFFTKDNEKLIKDCFSFLIDTLRQTFVEKGIRFEEAVFQPTKKMIEWKPFKDALFYPWLKQADRQIVLSANEIYLCRNNKWAFSTVISSENGRQLMGYIMKQMEAALRKLTNYKFKLTANIDTVKHEAVSILNKAGLSLEVMINNTVAQFYKEATKTVVVVDPEALSRIRQEALVTQEKLIVPEQDKLFDPVIPIIEQHEQAFKTMRDIEQHDQAFTTMREEPSMHTISPAPSPTPLSNAWESLKNTLSKIELGALSLVLQGDIELKKYADECGIMLEVLVDGINEKAMDTIGDNLLDDEMLIYDDYIEQVKELIQW